MYFLRSSRRVFARLCVLFAAVIAGASGSLLGVCGPFTDVSDAAFCPFVLEIFTLGITTGTSPTTYDPSGNVSRIQMAAFLSRTVDRTLQRASRRAALNQFWTTQSPANLGLTTTIPLADLVQSDGLDIWVASGTGTVIRVRGSDGSLLQTWTGAVAAQGVLAAMSQVFVAGQISPGRLYRIDPTQPAGAVTTVASTLGDNPKGIAYDGGRIWTANFGGSVSIVTPTVSLPWTVTTVTTGFQVGMIGALYDGANVWVTDINGASLQKLDAAAGVLQTVTVGTQPFFPIFDGTNIWVPNSGSASVSVVRSSTGAVLATLTGNGLNQPKTAAFDGERILVTNPGGGSVSLWKAADLSPIGNFQTGTTPTGACSDGINFWIGLPNANKLARF
jgi:hypothetical protein